MQVGAEGPVSDFTIRLGPIAMLLSNLMQDCKDLERLIVQHGLLPVRSYETHAPPHYNRADNNEAQRSFS